LNTTAY